MHLEGTVEAVLEIGLGAHRHTGSGRVHVAVVGEEMWEEILDIEMVEEHCNRRMDGRRV
jgi:hypothetical protein